MRGGATAVLALLMVVQPARMATDRPKGPQSLVCYQCTADSRKHMPVCDAAFWKVTTPAERFAREELCPPPRRSFCIMKVQLFRGYVLTTRGCAGDVDNDGHKLREGCETVRPDPETEDDDEQAYAAIVCFCKRSRCNAALPLAASNVALAAGALAAAARL